MAERNPEALRAELRQAVGQVSEPGLRGAAAEAWCRFMVEQYRPPAGQSIGLVLQCSVRRPFSKSPSHAPLRRAVRLATGVDPAVDFARCPVHVVVLASHLGPVPYELEAEPPASLRAPGVKQMSDSAYAAARPLLAERLAAYFDRHGRAWQHLVAFCHGRYAKVAELSAALAGRELTILPDPDGPQVRRLADKVPRAYWQRTWIQLCLALLDRLPEETAAEGRGRLGAVDYELG